MIKLLIVAPAVMALYNGDQAKLYKELAEANGLTLTQMAIAFVNRQKFVTSTIIGATTMEQLQENIAAFDTILTDEIVAEIEKIQELIPNPAP